MSTSEQFAALEAHFSEHNLQSLSAVERFHSYRLDPDDTADGGLTDPAIVAADVSSQTTYIRKLKFQYIEQNAKDKYVKYIVNDLDDAPFIGEHDIKELDETNQQLKAELNAAKAKSAKLEETTKQLAPQFAKKYNNVRRKLGRGRHLAQKILDARLALTRLQQIHPHPRLTIPTANQKLEDQVMEMQTLSDELELRAKELSAIKDKVKKADLEVETLGSERLEVEKELKKRDIAEDDRRLAPLYDWYTQTTSLVQTGFRLGAYEAPSDNELRLTYRHPSGKVIIVCLVFLAGSRQLAEIRVMDENGRQELLTGSEMDIFAQSNDAQGGISAALCLW